MSFVTDICEKTKLAANKFAGADTATKNAALLRAKELLLEKEDDILAANAEDIKKAEEGGRNAAFIDRLRLTPARIRQMCDGIDAIVALPDPVGEVTEHYTLPNGLDVKKVRAPLGVIGIIFEARPNVALDAGALCVKSGNGVILRGSRDSVKSVAAITACMKRALEEKGIDPCVVGLIESMDREATAEMLRQDKYIDVVIPRGGEALKKVSADFDMAMTVILNAKTNRPSTCNALETILADRKIARDFLPGMLAFLKKNGVEIRGTREVKDIYPDCIEVGEEEFTREYDNMIIKVAIVDGLTEAIDHINKYGTNHSDAIITEDKEEAARFAREVDSSAVYVNASTRFTDGFELGLGAEMGISTQKLHVRGPVGLKELTSVKYVVTGNGQVRK